MGLFDDIQRNVDAVAGKIDLPRDKVDAVLRTLRDELARSGNKPAALTATAQKEGVPIDRISDLPGHDGGDLAGELRGIAGRLL